MEYQFTMDETPEKVLPDGGVGCHSCVYADADRLSHYRWDKQCSDEPSMANGNMDW